MGSYRQEAAANWLTRQNTPDQGSDDNDVALKVKCLTNQNLVRV